MNSKANGNQAVDESGRTWKVRGSRSTRVRKQPSPAIVLMLAALLVLIFGPRIELIWSVGLISFGAWLIFRGTGPREKQA